MFIFYKMDNILICVNDEEHPVPITSSLWDKDNKAFIRKGPPHYDRIVVPCYRVRPEDRELFLQENVLACIQSNITANKECENKKEYNCFVPYKNIEDGTIELGICAYDAIGKIVDEGLTNYIEKQFKLKAFW